MRNIFALAALLFAVITVLEFNTPVEAKSHNRWPTPYIECLWKMLDYLDTMSTNIQKQTDDIHALREKLAK